MTNRRKIFFTLFWMVLILVFAGILLWGAYLSLVKAYSWAPWTGIGSFTSPAGVYFRAKTLWDWVDLLAAPLAIILVGIFFYRAHRKMTLEISSRQSAVAQEIARRERFKDRELASEQRRLENATSSAYRLDVLLREYLDRMQHLILEEGLREAREDSASHVRSIAQARTVASLRMLDASRRTVLLHFLRSSGLSDSLLVGASMQNLDLRSSDLTRLNLTRADLSRCDLGEASLYEVKLSEARLHDASLARARLSLVNLKGADLKHADLSKVRLNQVNLSGADLSGVDLREAYLRGENLVEARLANANLRGAVLSEARLKAADLRQADLTGADLIQADLSAANLNAAVLSEARLDKADLSLANLTQAVFSHAVLKDARLNQSDLTGAYLNEANLSGADLSGALLTQADFKGADLTGAKITPEQIQQAASIEGANLPQDSSPADQPVA